MEDDAGTIRRVVNKAHCRRFSEKLEFCLEIQFTCRIGLTRDLRNLLETFNCSPYVQAPSQELWDGALSGVVDDDTGTMSRPIAKTYFWYVHEGL